MKNMECNTKDLIALFEEQGVFVEESNCDEGLSLDSLTLVSLVISIEYFYSIEIPDEYLTYEKFDTINKVQTLVTDLLSEDKVL